MSNVKRHRPPPAERPVSRWDNLPPPEMRLKRDVVFADNMSHPAIVVPPVKPLGYAVKTKKQPLEQALTEAEYKALSDYVYHRIGGAGVAKTSDLNSSGGGGYESKLPFSDRQDKANRWLAHIDRGLAPEHIWLLKKLIAACMSDERLDIAGIGQYLTGSKDYRRQLGGFQGAFKAIAQAILDNDKKYQRLSYFGEARQIMKLTAK